MDRLSIVINPAIANGEPCIAGTNMPTSTIAAYVWEGYSLSDICLVNERLNALSIFNACWFESKYGSKKWQIRWREWSEYATPFLNREECDDLVLPPQKLQFLHTPRSLFYEYGEKMHSSWSRLIR